MSVRGSFLGGASRIPAREDLRCRRHETAPRARRFGSARSGPGTHALDRRGGGVRRPGPSGRARRPGLGRFCVRARFGFPAVPDRSEASLREAEAEGLHARIRGSWNSRPIGLIREARRRGTEGTGPILTAASCSHSPARRPAHLGGFSGSVGVSFPGLIHETLNRASRRALAASTSRIGQPRALGDHAGLQITP